jgi:hypothetical protein
MTQSNAPPATDAAGPRTRLRAASRPLRDRLRARAPDAAALGACAAFFLCAFGWAIFSGRYVAGGDVFFYNHPMRAAAWRMIREGHAPVWTPHVLSGFPLLAMSQLALGYPLTWGHLFLPPHAAEQVYIFAPFLLAPAFTYAYCRTLGRSRTASLLAGLAYGYGGWMTNVFGMSGLPSNPTVWLPLVLAAAELARTRPLARCVALAGAAYTMSVLTGYGQGFLYVGVISILYSLFVSIFVGREHAGSEDGGAPSRARGFLSPARWRPALVGVAAVALGAGVSAFQILETLRAQRRSIRGSISYDLFSELSFTPAAALKSFAAPLYNYAEVTAHTPALAALAALCGVTFELARAARPRRRATDARVFFWLAVAVVSFLLMLGDATPLNRWLFRVPVLNLFRRPSRHAFEWTFAISVLAAYGWDAASGFASRRLAATAARLHTRAAVAAALALLAACLWIAEGWHAAAAGRPYVGEAAASAEGVYLRWKLAHTACAALAVAACWLVRPAAARRALLASVMITSVFAEPRTLIRLWWPGTLKTVERLTGPSRATRYLRGLPPEENRVYVRANSAVEEYAADPRFDTLALTAPYGLHNAAGYEQLISERYSRALGGVSFDAITPRGDPAANLSLFAARSRVLDLLNVTHVVAFPDLRVVEHEPPPTGEQLERAFGGAPPLDPARWQRAAEFGGVLVLRNRRALPRAWLVAEAEAVDGEEALRRIRGEGGRDFDPARTALLEVRPDELPPLPAGSATANPRAELAGPAAFAGAARVVAYEPNRVAVETDSPSPAVLVLSELFYPGWEATVDGEARPIMLTNFLLRGVAVPAGRHTVEVRYAAPAARNGAIISALSLAALLALALVARRGAGLKRARNLGRD